MTKPTLYYEETGLNIGRVMCECGGWIYAGIKEYHSGIPVEKVPKGSPYHNYTIGDIGVLIDVDSGTHHEQDLIRLYCDTCQREYQPDEVQVRKADDG